MLRNLLAISALTLLGGISAVAQVSIGVKGSVQFANIIVTPTTQKASSLVGFQAGLMLDAPITDQLSIRPQLLYSVKGAKQTLNAQGVNLEAKVAVNYLEVPIQLTYGFEVGEGRVVIGAGPYLGYGLSGSTKSTVTFNGQTETETEDITFGDDGDLKRIDIGLHFSAGYELSSGLMVSGYFSPGLTNISNNATVGTNESAKTTAFGLSLGYFFGSRN